MGGFGYLLGMKKVMIRDVPDEVHENLKERARRNRRSQNQRVLADSSQMGFQDAAAERTARVDWEILESENLRARTKGFLMTEEIDAAKRDGLA